mgnify:CR=1 FL=1
MDSNSFPSGFTKGLSSNTEAKNDAYTNLIYEFFISGYDKENMNIYQYVLDMAKEKDVEMIIKLTRFNPIYIRIVPF